MTAPQTDQSLDLRLADIASSLAKTKAANDKAIGTLAQNVLAILQQRPPSNAISRAQRLLRSLSSDK